MLKILKYIGVLSLYALSGIFLWLFLSDSYPTLSTSRSSFLNPSYRSSNALDPILVNLTNRKSTETVFFDVMSNIDEHVVGSPEYKNYLRATIYNEAHNLNVGDDGLVEYALLLIRNRANVGIAQVGPSGSNDGFIDRWLENNGYNSFDLLTRDELAIIVKDAYVVDRQIFEVDENFEYIKQNFGINCANDPRNCGEIWTNKVAVRKITQDPGSDKVEDHHTRIWNFNCNQAGLFETDFNDYELIGYNIVPDRNVCDESQTELSNRDVNKILEKFNFYFKTGVKNS